MIFTVIRLIHPLNAYSPIVVRQCEIVIDGNDTHPENALAPMDETEDGIVKDLRWLQL